jgi:O-antigen/teichoic acid export membrane protein
MLRLVLLARIFGAALSFIITMLVAKLLDAEESGYFLLVVNFMLMFASFANGGISNYILSKFSGIDSIGRRREALVCLLCFFSFILLLLLFLVYMLLNYIFVDLPLTITFIILIGCGLHLLQIQVSTIYVMKGRPLLAVMIEVVLPPLFFLILFGFFYGEMQPLLLYVIAFSLIYVPIILKFMLKVSCLKELDFEDFRNASGSIANFFLVSILSSLASFLPVQLGSVFFSVTVVGQVIIAMKLTSLVRIVYQGVMSIYIKKMSKAYVDGGMASLAEVLRRVTMLLFLVSIIYFVALLVLIPFVDIFFDEKYQDLGFFILIIYIGQAIFVSFGGVGYALMIVGQESNLKKAMFYNIIFSGFIGVLCSLFLGVYGLCLGIALIISGQHIFAYVALRVSTGFRFIRSSN